MPKSWYKQYLSMEVAMPRNTPEPTVAIERWRLDQLGDELDRQARFIIDQLPEPWNELDHGIAYLETHAAVEARRYEIVLQVLEYAEQHCKPAPHPYAQDRIRCPLCNGRPQIEPDGYAVPVGLQRHLEDRGGEASGCMVIAVWYRYANRHVHHYHNRPFWFPYTDR